MKKKIKLFMTWFFVVLVSPLLISYFVIALIFKDSPIMGFSQFLSLFPGKVGSYLRVAFYRFVFTQCDSEVVISFATIFSQQDTSIEKGVYIGPQCNIGMCHIGKNSLIASGVHIMSGKNQHNFDDLFKPIQQQGGVFEKISIGDDSWIGNGALIMANIGKHCIIGAGSVVVSDVEDYSIMVGNPAKLVKKRKD